MGEEITLREVLKVLSDFYKEKGEEDGKES